LRVCEFLEALRVASLRVRGKGCKSFESQVFGGKKRETLCATPPSRTGGAVALKLRARLSPAGGPRRTPVRGVLYPSLGAHIEVFWSAAATKREQLPARRDASGFSFLPFCFGIFSRDSPPKTRKLAKFLDRFKLTNSQTRNKLIHGPNHFVTWIYNKVYCISFRTIFVIVGNTDI